MASLYKRTYSVKDPATGKTVKKTGKKWWGKYTDANGNVQRVPLYGNKVLAREKLEELVGNVELGKAGYIDPYEKFRNVPIKDHVNEFRLHLESKENTERHVDQTIHHVKRAAKECRFKLPFELNSDVFSNWLAARRDDPKTSKDFGVTTSNHYLTAMKSFGAWMVKTERIERNPFAFIKALSAKAKDDIRVERRALEIDELTRLIETAEKSKSIFRRLSGPDRAALYLLAGTTGFRANELRTLRVSSFSFDSDSPTVSIKPKNEKARRGCEMPLDVDVANRLSAWMKTNRLSNEADSTEQTDSEVWPGSWSKKAAEMFRRDMDEARNEWLKEVEEFTEEHGRRVKSDFLKVQNKSGETADFHALRHTFITIVNSSGADPKVVQKLARHSSFKMTYDRYCHTRRDDLREAVKNMPSLVSGEPTGKPNIIETTATRREESLIVVPDLCPESYKYPSLVTTIDETDGHANLAEQQKTPEKHSVSQGFSEKAPVGVEPTMTDLQSVDTFECIGENRRFAATVPATVPKSETGQNRVKIIADWSSLPEWKRHAIDALLSSPN